MANRYWVGGSGTWDATNTANWSTASNGSGGASVPTTADNVFFDSSSSASNYTVTISLTFVGTASFSTITSMTSVVTVATVTSGTLAVGDLIRISQSTFKITSLGTGSGGAGTYNCNVLSGYNGTGSGTTSFTASRQACADINIAGPASGTLSWSASSSSIEVAGSITTAATGVNVLSFNIIATGSGTHTITSNGLSFGSGSSNYLFLCGTGTYTLNSALTCGSLFFSYGTFTTANYALSVNQLDQSSDGTRTTNFGSSTVTITSTGYPLGTRFSSTATFNAGTSNVIFNGYYAYIIPFGSKTWYNVTFTSTNISNIYVGIGLGYIGEVNTFNNLTIYGQTTTGVANIWIGASNTIINGTFTIGAGTSAVCRLSIGSGDYSSGLSLGTTKTITAAAFAAGATDVDWHDITIAGAAGTISGTRFGNLGGCTNITFDTPKTVYWNLAGSQNWSATGWATSSGGTPAAANFPLAQDTVVFDNTGSAGTVTIDKNWNIGTVNMSGRTSAMTLSVSSLSIVSATVFGSWTNGSGTTLSGSGTITFANRSPVTLTPNGVTFTPQIIINCTSSGGLSLGGALTATSLFLNVGIFTLNNYTVNISIQFQCIQTRSAATATSIAYGTGVINITGASGIFAIDDGGSNYFTSSGTSTINLTYSGSSGSRTVYCRTSSTYAQNVNVTGGSDIIGINQNQSTYNNLNFTGFTGTVSSSVNPLSIYGNLTLGTGMTISAFTSTVNFSGSTIQTLTTNGVTISFPIAANGTGTFTSGSAITSTSTYTTSGSMSTDFSGISCTFSSVTLGSSGNLGLGGILTVTGSGTCFSETVSRGTLSYNSTAYISATSSSPKTLSYYPGNSNVGINQGGTGALTITTSTGAGTIKLSGCPFKNTVQPATISITGGITLSNHAMQLNGTSGNLITLGSTNTTPVILVSATLGSSSYCSVSYMNASVGIFRFFNSTNGGNNTNILFPFIYYWVGGSGTWNNSSTTNWSLTSGGAGAQGPPTANDDVIFNTSSNATAYTVTMGTGAVCFNMTMAGPTTGQVTWAGSTTMNIYGSMTLSGTAANGGVNKTYNPSSPGITFSSTAYGNTITTNGVSFAGITFTLSGLNGDWTLGSALNVGYVYHTAGSFFTAGYAVTAIQYYSSGSISRTLYLSNTTWTAAGASGSLWCVLGSNYSIVYGISTINITGYGNNLQFGNTAYYNVVFNYDNQSDRIVSISDTGTNTFNSLTFNPSSTTPNLNEFVLSGNITITSSTVLNSGGTYNNRLFVHSDTTGTQRNFNWTGGSTIAYCDFRDINATAGAIGSSGGTVGDCGGNTNVTGATPKTVYWNLAGTQNWSATGWATSSGGTPSAANFPLAQDTAYFDNTGSAGTVTIDKNWNIGSVDMSTRTTAMTLATGFTTPTVYGNWNNGSGTTLSGTGTITFNNRLTKNINSAGKTFSQPINLDAPSGGLFLSVNNLTISQTFSLIRGTLALNNLALTCTQFLCNTSSTTTSIIFVSTGAINCTGNAVTVLQILYSTFTYTGTSQINLTYSGSVGTRSFNVNMGINSPSINVTAGTDIVDLALNSGYSIGSINFTGFTGSLATTSNAITLYGNLILGSGMTISGYTGNMTFAATTGTQTVTTNGVTIGFPIIANGGGTWGMGSAITSSSTLLVSGTTALNYNYNATFSAITLSTSGNVYYNTSVITITGSGTCFTQTVNHSAGWNNNASYYSYTSSSAKTASYLANGTSNAGINQGGAGTLTITTSTGAGSIGAIAGNGKLTNTVQPATILITAGVTLQLVTGGLNLNGTSGNLITLGSTTTSAASITTPAGGISTSNYCSVSYITGVSTGSPLFRFLNSTNGGNNTNLTFGNTYYWVGGSGTWNNSSTTNWSLTSAGAGAQGPPTANDDVIFDSASNATAYTVTTGTSPACFNITVNAPASGKVTLNTSAGTLSIYGSLNFAAGTSGMVLATSSNIIFAAQYTGNTITTNGILAAGSGYTFNGLNGVWTLGSDIWVYIMVITNGTLNTSTSNYKITAFANIQFPSGTNGIVLNGSTVETASWLVGGNPTITAGTSTIKLQSVSSANFQGAGKTYYNLELNSSASPITISGSNTFNNISNNSQPLTINFTAGTTQTVANLNLNGTSGNLITLGSTTTSAFTITGSTAGVNTCTYCSVSYMTGTATATGGGGVVWRFFNSTNSGNNTNLTFSNIYYWVGGTGTWDATTTTNWSLTSGGSGGAGVPTSADDAIFNSASNATSYTVTTNIASDASCFNLTVTGPATGTLTHSGTGRLAVYGNLSFPSSGLAYSLSYVYMPGVSVCTISCGVTISQFITGITPGGSQVTTGVYRLAGALTCGFLLTNGGTFDTSTSNYSLTVSSALSVQVSSGTLSLNGSTVTISGYITINSASTVNAGTSTINFIGQSNVAKNLTFGGKTFATVVINSTFVRDAQYTISDTLTNTFSQFTYHGSSASPSFCYLTISGTIVTTNLNLNGVYGAFNNRLFVKSNTLGTQRTITYTSGSSASNLDLQDINATNTFGAYLGNCGNNTNFTFSAAKTVYWNLAGTQNWSATGWATSSGGTPLAANFPLAQDTVVFDNTGSAGTINIDKPWNTGTIDTSTRTTAMTLNFPGVLYNDWAIYGSINLSSAVTLSNVATYGISSSFFGRGNTQTITLSGSQFFPNIAVLNLGGTVSLSTNMSCGGILLFYGTFNLNNFTVTLGAGYVFQANSFYSTSSTRSIAFGTTGAITFTGASSSFTAGSSFFVSSGLTNFTVTGTSRINLNLTGSSATGGTGGTLGIVSTIPSTQTFKFYVTSGSYPFDISNTSATSIDFTGFTGSLVTSSTASTLYGNLTIASGMTVSGYTGTITFSAGATVATNGVTINFPIVVNAGSGVWVNSDALTSTSSISVTSALVFGNNASMTFSTFSISGPIFNLYNALTITGSGSAFTVSGTASINAVAGGDITMSSSSAKTFAGNGKTYLNLIQGGAGALTITGSNTFANITNTVSPTSIIFTAGTTQTVSDLALNGTPGNLVTLASSTGSSIFTITRKTSGTSTSTYCSVSWMTGTATATGGGSVIWSFKYSTSGGNNTNLIFSSTYYWVGGTGTWDGTTLTNWATSSGGSGGGGVPTINDDAIFNTASASPSVAYTVTVGTGAVCSGLNMAGPTTGQITWAGSASLSISGSMTLSGTASNGGVNVTYQGQLTLTGTSTGLTVTTNGVIIPGFIVFNGVGGYWTLGSSLTASVDLSNGTLDTSASSYTVTATSFSSSGSGTRALKLNASTWNVTSQGSSWSIIGSNMTLTAGTSTISFASGTQNVYFNGYTYYNVIFNSGNTSSNIVSIKDTVTNTFNSLTFNASSTAPSLSTLTLSGNLTITGAGGGSALSLNSSSSAVNNRLFLLSNTLGTQRTITTTGATQVNCDYRDIAGGGSFNFTGALNNCGDCGGNSTLTFTAAKTVYWNLAGSQNWSATGWATSSGGTPSAANFPLAQDTVVFDNTGSVGTVTIDNNWNIGSFLSNSRTNSWALATGSTTPTFCGSAIYMSSSMTLTGTGTLTISFRSNNIFISSNGITFTQPIVIDAPGVITYVYLSNLVVDNSVTLNQGTLSLTYSGSNYNLTCQSFSSNNSNTRAIAFGTGSIVTSPGLYGTVFNMQTATNFTYTGTPTVIINGTSALGGSKFVVFGNSGGGSITNALSFAFTGTPGASISGYCKNLDLSGVTAGGNFPANNNSVTIYGDFTLSPSITLNASTGTITFGATSGTQTVTTSGKTITFPIVQNGAGGTVNLADAFTSSNTITITNGNFGFIGGAYSLTATTFTAAAGVGLYFGGNTWTITGSTFTVSGTPSTVSTSTGHKISMTSASAKTFVGGSVSYSNTTLEQAGAGALTISGSNTFSTLSNSVTPASLTFTAGTTQTVNTFSLAGTSPSSLVTLTSTTPGTQFRISQPAGTVVGNYLSLRDSSVIGNAIWYAPPAFNTNVSNNSGWQFNYAPGNIKMSLSSSGNLTLSTGWQFDEVTQSTISLNNNSNRLYSSQLDEVTIYPANNNLVKRETSTGRLQIGGTFDEVSGLPS